MKTIQNIFTCLIIFSLLGGFLSSCGNSTSNTGGINIAVAEANPIDKNGNTNPDSYYAGVLLAVSQVNEMGGVDGVQVNVNKYVDEGDPAKAAENAREIVASSALAVIGHSTSETTSAAAESYDAAGIPAINVIPDNELLTVEHKSYYNITHTADIEAIYTANYLVKVLKEVDANGNSVKKYATIYYADDRRSQTTAETFRNTFSGLGGEITLERMISDESQITDLVDELVGIDTSVKNPGTIFIAMPGEMAAKLVVEIRRKGLAYQITGSSTLANGEFANHISGQGEEETQPGYFTDGVATVRSVIGDSILGPTQQIFDAYAQLYPGNDQGPSDAFLAGYDAALAVMGAVDNSSLSGDVIADRKVIYSALGNLGNNGDTIQGTSGPIAFQQNRNAIRTPRFGIYQNGQLISTLIQFKRIGAMPYSSELQQQIDSGRIMTVGGEYVYVVNVVYTGIDMLSAREVDIKNSTYKLDYYLWFRYRQIADQTFTPDDFNFTNIESLDGKSLISEESSGGVTTKTYRVLGTFKNQFNFQDYPFDRQSLVMQLRNKSATTDEIEYVVDKLGMKYPSNEALMSYWKENNAFSELFGWNPHTALAEQKIFSTASTLGNPKNFEESSTTDYSLFTASVIVHRNSLSFIIKSLLPLLITLTLAYITFYLPLGHSERLGVGSTALLTTAFFHLNLSSSLPDIGYTVAMEYFFYASYLMAALIVFLETWSIRLEKRGENEQDETKKAALAKKRNQLNMAGRIIYPSILGVAILMGGLFAAGTLSMSPDENASDPGLASQVASNSSEDTSSETAKASEQAGGVQGNTTGLVLMTWRPEDAKEMQTILDAFSEYAKQTYNKEITITYEPIMSVNYDSIVQSKLELKEKGPDLIYVRPYSVDGSISEYLLPLNNAQLNLSENYEDKMLEPWVSATGNYFGLPFGGVVQAIYYNKDLFQSAGVKIPENWLEFLDASQKLKDYSSTLPETQQFVPIANGINDRQDSEMFQSISINTILGEPGRRELMEGKLCYDDPTHIVRAFGAINELKPFIPDDAAGLTAEASKQLFFQGKAAMLFGGSWDVSLAEREATTFNWGVFAPPQQYDETYVIFNPDVAIGVNKNSLHKEEARIFLEWLESQQAINLLAENLPGFYPLSYSHKPQNVVTGADAQFIALTKNNETDARWVYIEISNKYPRADEIVRIALSDMLANGLSPADAATRLQTGLSEWYTPAQICKFK